MYENEGTVKVQEVACIREGTENEAFGASHLNTMTARVLSGLKAARYGWLVEGGFVPQKEKRGDGRCMDQTDGERETAGGTGL